jgi:hypothetical protein
MYLIRRIEEQGMSLKKAEKTAIMSRYHIHASDTGSPEAGDCSRWSANAAATLRI